MLIDQGRTFIKCSFNTCTTEVTQSCWPYLHISRKVADGGLASQQIDWEHTGLILLGHHFTYKVLV